MRSKLLRPVAASMLAMQLAGCATNWYSVPGDPREYIATTRPRAVRVIRADSSAIELSYPSIQGDSIFAFDGPVCGPRVAAGCAMPIVGADAPRVGLIDASRLEYSRFEWTGWGAMFAVAGGGALLYFMGRELGKACIFGCDD